jgi:hypothetical protein
MRTKYAKPRPLDEKELAWFKEMIRLQEQEEHAKALENMPSHLRVIIEIEKGLANEAAAKSA